MAGFRSNTTENLTFWLKYRQRKVDLNVNEKSLVFVTIRHRKFHLYVQLLYTKMSCLSKNTHLQRDAAFLHFCLKESSENMIFPWNGKIWNLTKKWSFLSFSQISVRRKFFFSCSVLMTQNRKRDKAVIRIKHEIWSKQWEFELLMHRLCRIDIVWFLECLQQRFVWNSNLFSIQVIESHRRAKKSKNAKKIELHTNPCSWISWIFKKRFLKFK